MDSVPLSEIVSGFVIAVLSYFFGRGHRRSGRRQDKYDDV